MKKQILSLGFTLLAATSSFGLPSLLDKKEFKADSVSNLDIHLSWENIEIQEVPSKNPITVEIYCNKKKFAPKVNFSGSTLTIESIPFNPLFFPMEPKHCTVMIHIPSAKNFKKAGIRLSSGSLKQLDSISAEQLTIQASSGSLSASNLKGSQIEVSASSGRISIERLVAAKATVHTSSGSISVDSINSQNYVSETSSGSIKLKDVTAQSINLSTSSGGISVDGLLAGKISASSTSGTIGLELNGVPSEKSHVSTTSGTIFVSLPRKAGVTVSASTTSGSFVNTFTKEKINSHVEYKKAINGGGTSLHLSSTSGRITLDEGDGFSSGGSKSGDDDIPVVNLERPIF